MVLSLSDERLKQAHKVLVNLSMVSIGRKQRASLV